MKKVNGFTLIELLAVIVILGVIAVITIPAITNVVENSKISSYMRSSEGIVHATENYYNNYKLGNVEDIKGNLYDEIMNNVSGKTPDSGDIYVDKDGYVAFAFEYDGYCFHKNYKTNEIYYEKTENCQYPMDYLKVSETIGYVEESQFDAKADSVSILGSDQVRSKFESITTLDSNVVPDGITTAWDVSERKNGSVMAWYTDTDNNGLFELYIGQDGGVIANKNCNRLFAYFTNLKSIDLSNFNTSNVEDMAYMFYYTKNLEYLDVSSFDTSNVTLTKHMFENMRNLKVLDVTNFDTSNVTEMQNMFAEMYELESLDLSHFDTSKVVKMDYMFNELYKLKFLDISNFNTSKIEDMSGMFYAVRSLEHLDVSSFDTSNVKDMRHIFDGMQSLKTLDVSNFDTSKVQDMAYMFKNLRSLPILDVSSLNTTSVTDMKEIFGSSNFNMLKINSFTFDKVSIYQDMFLYSNINNIEVGTSDNKVWIESRLSESNKTANVSVVPVQNN